MRSFGAPDQKAIAEAVDRFQCEIEQLVFSCEQAGAYMPSLATRLRIHADELADRFPDDTNGGAA